MSWQRRNRFTKSHRSRCRVKGARDSCSGHTSGAYIVYRMRSVHFIVNYNKPSWCWVSPCCAPATRAKQKGSPSPPPNNNEEPKHNDEENHVPQPPTTLALRHCSSGEMFHSRFLTSPQMCRPIERNSEPWRQTAEEVRTPRCQDPGPSSSLRFQSQCISNERNPATNESRRPTAALSSFSGLALAARPSSLSSF